MGEYQGMGNAKRNAFEAQAFQWRIVYGRRTGWGPVAGPECPAAAAVRPGGHGDVRLSVGGVDLDLLDIGLGDRFLRNAQLQDPFAETGLDTVPVGVVGQGQYSPERTV